MGVAHDGGIRSISPAHVQQRFQPSRWAVQIIDGLDGGSHSLILMARREARYSGILKLVTKHYGY